jgi:uncharacterized protein YjbI with pentapeptide repeats
MQSFKAFLKKPKPSCQQLGYFALAVGLAFGVYCAISSPEQIGWTGFKQDTEITRTKKILKNGKEITVVTKYVSGKTLWDWLGVFWVPLSLAILGFWFQQQQQIRSDQQAILEKEIAESNQKEEVLQAYFDRLATLLIDQNLIAIAAKFQEYSDTSTEEQDLLRASTDVIRARTLSILRRLGDDGERKFSVMQFLIEAGVISQLNLDLSGADLRSAKLCRINLSDVKLSSANLIATDLQQTNLDCADLSGADLSDADLSDAYLSKAKLSSAILANATLIGATLVDATLISAKLSGANLSSANLFEAYLLNANFSDTNLSDTNLSGAIFIGVNLFNANLSSAKGFTSEQAVGAKLCQTKLPPDIQIDPNRDCEELGIQPN